METGRYNLRSSRIKCSVPFQLQLATDDKFVTGSIGRAESTQVGEAFSELSDSESDIELSDLVCHSNKNLSLNI